MTEKILTPIARIQVRLRVGESLMAASDDPVFLGLRGGCGREFRLRLAKGRSLRRGHEDHFVMGQPEDRATNVDHPELNDPTTPPLDAALIASVYIRKGFEPVPNVRAVAEMDDRLEILESQVEIEVEGGAEPLRFRRQGPLWLGLVSGLRIELPPVGADG